MKGNMLSSEETTKWDQMGTLSIHSTLIYVGRGGYQGCTLE
jgi:hypothetical protein